MAKFFFHIHGDVEASDDEGVELPDMAAVRDQAIKGAREIAAFELKTGKLNLRHRIEVEDEDRRPVLSLPFGSAFEIEQ